MLTSFRLAALDMGLNRGHGITTSLTLRYHNIADTLSGHMPWKKKSLAEQRLDLVRQMAAGKRTVEEICEHWGISRQTAYKWRARYSGRRLRGLEDKSRRPLCRAGPITVRWQRRVRRVRQEHPTWGARKLRYKLGRRFGARGAPSTATISRWLSAWGLA